MLARAPLSPSAARAPSHLATAVAIAGHRPLLPRTSPPQLLSEAEDEKGTEGGGAREESAQEKRDGDTVQKKPAPKHGR